MERRNTSRRWASTALVISAAVAGMPLAQAAEIIYDSSNAAGITTASGTWDYANTARWSSSEAGSDPLLAWTSNSNTAVFIPGSSATVTVNGSNGQVGAAGLRFQGTSTGALTIASTGGATLQLGAGGISSTLAGNVVDITSPVVLTGSQATIAADQLRNNNSGASGAVVRLTGAVSSLSGTTNLTFDGQGLSNAYGTANTDARVIFSMSGINTYAGTTTVTGGAALTLSYASGLGGNTSRLDDSRAVVLAGGSIVMNGGPSTTDLTNGAVTVSEIVSGTSLTKGANSIYAGPSGGGGTKSNIQLGAITRTAQAGGVLDVTNAVSSLAFSTTGNTNGIVGGWGTMAGSWLTNATDGVTPAAFGSTSGSNQSLPANWTSTMNVNATASASDIGSKVVNALRVSSGNTNVALTFASDATLTLTSGGLIGGGATGHVVSGGKITSGLASGELFVHTPTNAFTLGSAVANNGATPTILVKAGKSTLIATGVNTNTGGTIIDAGTLQLDGSLATGDIRLESGTLNGTGTINYRVTGDDADLININGGLVAISGLHFNVLATGTQSLGEYVIADRAVGSAYISGSSFFETTGLPDGWSVDYDGTASNPGKIVLVVPEPASLALAGLAGVIGLRRRRR